MPTIPDYYYSNVFAGNLINVTVSPSSAGGNYNLGLEVFDGNQILIAEDSNPLDFSASISLVANYNGRMYFRVYQLLTAGACTGGTYTIAFTVSPPTPTPIPRAFGYGMVIAGQDNPWPNWIGFDYQLAITSPVTSGGNKLLRLAADAADLADLSGMQARVGQIVSANGSVTLFQIGNDPNLILQLERSTECD